MLLQDPASLSWSNLWLGCKADVWGKNKSKKEKKRRRTERGHTTLVEPGMPLVLSESSLCKIASSFISNCLFFAGWFLKKTPVKFVCHCLILPELFKLKCSACGREEGCQRAGSAEKKHQTDPSCGKFSSRTLVGQTPSTAQITSNQNKLSRLWPTQIRT